MSALDAALAAAARGWHVFPCQADKTPRRGWRWKEWNTADPAKIRQWLADAPRAGIACGPSGLVVIDLDMPKPGYQLPPEWQAEPGISDGRDVLAALCERAGEPWPWTYTTATMSGGWHLYFTAPPGRPIGNSAAQLGPLIDIRGDGGYVIAYDPWHDAAPVPLPAWLACACASAEPEAAVPARPVAGAGGNRAGYVRAAFARELEAVASAPQGQRNNQLNRSAFAVARFVAAGELHKDAAIDAFTAAAQHAGLDPAGIRKTLASAFSARGAS